jgi:hypothetical protein
VICTLGNFATKLLRADPAGITRVHGQPQIATIGSHTTRLFPIHHPAAALYTPRTMDTLREDFHALPALLALPAPAPSAPAPVPESAAEPGRPSAPQAPAAEPTPEQLGLF